LRYSAYLVHCGYSYTPGYLATSLPDRFNYIIQFIRN